MAVDFSTDGVARALRKTRLARGSPTRGFSSVVLARGEEFFATVDASFANVAATNDLLPIATMY